MAVVPLPHIRERRRGIVCPGMYHSYRVADKWRGAFEKCCGVQIKSRWTDQAMFAEVSKWSHSFRALMCSVKGRRLFKAFLFEQHAEENLAFWEAVEAFRTVMSRSERREFAHDIYREFIIPHAAAQVNLDHRSTADVAEALRAAREMGQSPESIIFDECQRQIYRGDLWHRFVRSRQYRRELISKLSSTEVARLEIEAWSHNFYLMLRHPFGRSLLFEFLRKDKDHLGFGSEKMISFWEAVQSYAKLPSPEHRRAMGRNMVNQFFLPPNPVLPITAQVLSETETGALDLWSELEQQVVANLRDGVWERFLGSGVYRGFRVEHRELSELAQLSLPTSPSLRVPDHNPSALVPLPHSTHNPLSQASSQTQTLAP